MAKGCVETNASETNPPTNSIHMPANELNDYEKCFTPLFSDHAGNARSIWRRWFVRIQFAVHEKTKNAFATEKFRLLDFFVVGR